MKPDVNKLTKTLSRIPDQDLDCKNGRQSGDCVGGMARKILGIPGFDNAMGAIIIFNLVVMVMEIDATANEEELADTAMHWTDIFGWVVLGIFVFELIIRLIAFRSVFWHDPWNIADFIIVVTDFVFSSIGLVAGDVFPVSMLRIFRLSKLARVSKVLRIFPELRMLLAGLMNSFRAIFWGILLLMIFLLVWSMIAVLVIHPLNRQIDYGESCARCPRAYSSVMHSALTLWQIIIAGDSWGMSTIPVIETYPVSVFFFLPCFASIGMSLMNLMLSVVISLAQKAYDEEAETEELLKNLRKSEQQENVMRLCGLMDSDKSGDLSRAEVLEGFKQPGEFRDELLDVGCTEDDFDTVWKILDIDGSGQVSYKELVTFLFTMKTSSDQFRLQQIQHYTTWIKDALVRQMASPQEQEQDQGLEIDRLLRKGEATIPNVIEEKKDLQLAETPVREKTAVLSPTVIDIDVHEKRAGLSPTVIDIDDVLMQVLSTARDYQPCAHAGDDTSKTPPVLKNATQAVKEVVFASNAMQDSVRQLSNDIERMHLDLGEALAEMQSRQLSNDIERIHLELKGALAEIQRIGYHQRNTVPPQQSSVKDSL